ncbi:unnamed protein product [Acanthoscelides obtectus]|uniref:Uncharacterized protein n=1 Tax=Acanthoscelides obtectus TaxID=200917 RepID=A0A9P0LGQ7_ACAOB|nr:unnamed protein product [Acanthoscelides obtectus]CAK1627147.1 hypothetical protein AOBTE_LOCUS4340 [Acanthoscelides obtectus]
MRKGLSKTISTLNGFPNVIGHWCHCRCKQSVIVHVKYWICLLDTQARCITVECRG